MPFSSLTTLYTQNVNVVFGEYIFWVPFLSSRIDAFKYNLSLLLWTVQLTVQLNNPKQ